MFECPPDKKPIAYPVYGNSSVQFCLILEKQFSLKSAIQFHVANTVLLTKYVFISNSKNNTIKKLAVNYMEIEEFSVLKNR